MTTTERQAPASELHRRELWFEADGVRLFAVEAGRGTPMVFLHGGLADHRAASFRVGRLAQTHRLVTPDLRGSGRSIFTGELSWDRLADDVASLLDHLGLERALIGGTSMGSAVAIRFALRHAPRLRALVLLSPLYPGADRPLAEAAVAAMQTMAEAGERALSQGLEALVPLFESLPSPVREVALEMMRGFDPGSVAATTRFLARLEQPMASARDLARISVPVMLVPGVDPQHPAEVAALLAQHLPRAAVVEPMAADLLEQISQLGGAVD